VLDGVHIGATCRIQLNRPGAAAIQTYVKWLWPFVSYTPFTQYNRFWNRLYNRFDNRLYHANKHLSSWETGCQTGWTNSHCSFSRLSDGFDKAGHQTGLTTGWMFVYTIQLVVKPVWKPVWQQVVSCKRGYTFSPTMNSDKTTHVDLHIYMPVQQSFHK